MSSPKSNMSDRLAASLELCKELFEISGWDDTDRGWHNLLLKGDDPFLSSSDFEPVNPKRVEGDQYHYPAYTLGYLLRKLPAWILKDVDGCYHLELSDNTSHGTEPDLSPSTEWGASYANSESMGYYGVTADTPENALTQLAIKLFKSGILRKEE